MSEKRERPERYGRVNFKNKETGEYELVGFLQAGKYGPELSFVTKANGSWMYGRKIVFADKNGNEHTMTLPKWPVNVYAVEGCVVGRAGGGQYGGDDEDDAGF